VAVAGVAVIWFALLHRKIGSNRESRTRATAQLSSELDQQIERGQERLDNLRIDPRVSYEETNRIIEIFKNSPTIKVAVTALGSGAGPGSEIVRDRAGWFHSALMKAGVDAKLSLWEHAGAVPEGTSIWWIKSPVNDLMAKLLVEAAHIKGLHPREVARPVSAGDCPVEIMIGHNPMRRSEKSDR
jgi:hypothetical protein